MNIFELREIINTAIIEVLQQFGIEKKIYSGNLIEGKAVHIQIEFVGNMVGYLILELTEEEALYLANKMFMGMMTVNQVDDMCKSSLGAFLSY